MVLQVASDSKRSLPEEKKEFCLHFQVVCCQQEVNHLYSLVGESQEQWLQQLREQKDDKIARGRFLGSSSRRADNSYDIERDYNVVWMIMNILWMIEIIDHQLTKLCDQPG